MSSRDIGVKTARALVHALQDAGGGGDEPDAAAIAWAIAMLMSFFSTDCLIEEPDSFRAMINETLAEAKSPWRVVVQRN